MEITQINNRLLSGIFTLTFRRILLYVIRFGTINLILASILTPAIIGVFNIANSILAFFTFFSDIGLAAAIIQKKEISSQDLKTTFTIQVLLAFLISLVIWFAAPVFASIYGLDISGMWLIRALSIGFLLTSFKVLPSVLLERDLRFKPLVLVEIAETLVFCASLIFLTIYGFEINGFSLAVVAQSIIGVVLIYIIAPWKISFGISKLAAKTLLNFGIPFQLNSVLALLKDRLVPLVIAKMVGTQAVGYITWAQNLAFLPLEVMNIVIRVTFPAFSRLQEDRENLKKTLDKSLFLTGLFLYPLLFGILAVAPLVVKYLVSSKWQSALPLIYLFAFSTFWASLSTTFTNVLNAIGKISISLKLMVMWTLLTWILTPLFVYFYGFLGVGIASAVISFTSIIPIVIVKKIIDVEIIANIWQPIFASIVMTVVVYILGQTFVKDWVTLVLSIFLGGIVYFCLTIALAKDRILNIFKNVV